MIQYLYLGRVGYDEGLRLQAEEPCGPSLAEMLAADPQWEDELKVEEGGDVKPEG